MLSSAGRRDAFRLIAKKCPDGSRIAEKEKFPKSVRQPMRSLEHPPAM